MDRYLNQEETLGEKKIVEGGGLQILEESRAEKIQKEGSA